MTKTDVLYGEGGNYRIELSDGIAYARVWRRPDVDLETGAGFVKEMIGSLERLRGESCPGLILDVSEAAPVAGPVSQAVLGQMLGNWARDGLKVAFVIGPKVIQRLQIQRLVNEYARGAAMLATAVDEARTWIEESTSDRSSA